MKKLLLWSMVVLVLVIGAFMAGGWLQNAKNGYHYQVLEEKTLESPIGPVRWVRAMETVGMPFLESDTTIIEADGLTVYKAKRGFQERSPSARNLRVHEGLIEWDDGDYSFSLKMQKLPAEGLGTKSDTKPGAI